MAPGRTKYTCNLCSEFFFVQDELDCHLNLDHDVKMDKVYCKRCKYPCKDLRTHKCIGRNKHFSKKKEQIFTCTQCQKTFKRNINLQSHIKSQHENSLDFDCTICGKKFALLKTLKNHIWQCHTPVSCKICEKTVATSIDLKKHIVLVHNNTNGAWLCDKCPKKVFFVKTNFEKHIREKH